MKLSLLCLLLAVGSTFTIVESASGLGGNLPDAADLKIGDLKVAECLKGILTQVPRIVQLVAIIVCEDSDAVNSAYLKENVEELVAILVERKCDLKNPLGQNVDEILDNDKNTLALVESVLSILDEILDNDKNTLALVESVLSILGRGDLVGKTPQQICSALLIIIASLVPDDIDNNI